MALAWLLHNPVVTAPIIGPRTLDQLTGSLRALKIKLNEAALKKLDEIWPGPGGEAPEAYRLVNLLGRRLDAPPWDEFSSILLPYPTVLSLAPQCAFWQTALFSADGQACLARLEPPLRLLGAEHVPTAGPA